MNHTHPASLTLSSSDSVERRFIWETPQKISRADGLWVWGATVETRIHQIRVGGRSQFAAGIQPIPALYFEAGCSFDDFRELAAATSPEELEKAFARLKRLPITPAHQHMRCDTAEIGVDMGLEVSGPLTHAVFWGLCVD